METKTQARASARALVGAAAFGSLVGLAVGVAYLGGSFAKSLTVKEQAARLADARKHNYSDYALIASGGVVDESALAVARRHDPYAYAGGAQRDRQAALLAARLERVRKTEPQDSREAGLRKASYTPGATTAAARPFRMSGGLEGSRDLECLTQAVYYEARGEGLAGMQAVAQVVLNRARHPAFPKSICGVVYQGAHLRTGCQFSFVCQGMLQRRPEAGAWRRAETVATRALSGQVMAEVGASTHFHATRVSPRWGESLVRVGQVGSHVFYRFRGRSGSPDALREEPRPSTGFEPPVSVASFAPPGVEQAGERVLSFFGVGHDPSAGGHAQPQPQGAPPADPAAAKPQAVAPAPAQVAPTAPPPAPLTTPAAPKPEAPRPTEPKAEAAKPAA